MTSNVGAVVDAEGVTHLYARGADGALWEMTQKVRTRATPTPVCCSIRLLSTSALLLASDYELSLIWILSLRMMAP